jgi:hypothetical protein
MEIYITGWQISGEDAERAQKVPISELPTLTPVQEKVAKGFEVSSEKYARILLSGIYSSERLRTSASRMAETLQSELKNLLPEAETTFFQYEVGVEPHRVLVRYEGKDHRFDSPSTDDSDDAMRILARGIASKLK